jgi:predicted anti-sigma-YlaC factor YlaD
MIDPQMRCVEFVELVTDWMEGALDDAAVARVEEHIVICPPCGAYVRQIRRATDLVGELDGDAPPEPARQALLEMFRAERRR